MSNIKNTSEKEKCVEVVLRTCAVSAGWAWGNEGGKAL